MMHLIVYAVALRDYTYAVQLYDQLTPLQLSCSDRLRIFQELGDEDPKLGMYSKDLATIGQKLHEVQNEVSDLFYIIPESFFIKDIAPPTTTTPELCYEIQHLLFGMQQGSLADLEASRLGELLRRFNLFHFFGGNDCERLQFIEETLSMDILLTIQLGMFGKIQPYSMKQLKALLVKTILRKHLAETNNE